MRFTTWNLAAGDSLRKLDRLSPMPDVGAFCEVRSDEMLGISARRPVGWVWNGRIPVRGVAVGSWTGALTEIHPTAGTAGNWSAAARTAGGTVILGIWSVPDRGAGSSYAGEVLKTIEAFAPLLEAEACIIAGDFNDGPRYPSRRSTHLLARLAELGYHSVVDEASALPTYFHQFKAGQPHYVDHVFVKDAMVVESVTVGSHDDWTHERHSPLRSDHVPITVVLRA